MSQAAHRMTLDEFDIWQTYQDVRCELVDGQVYAMTGATFAHDRLVANLLIALGSRLRAAGNPCAPSTADIGIVTGPSSLRRPDVAVHCPPFDDAATRSNAPTLVAEILSPSTQRIDQVAKLLEYRALPALRTILLLAPDQIDIGIWRRSTGDAWTYAHIIDDDAGSIDLPNLGVVLPVAELYLGASVKPVARPRLVWPDA